MNKTRDQTHSYVPCITCKLPHYHPPSTPRRQTDIMTTIKSSRPKRHHLSEQWPSIIVSDDTVKSGALTLVSRGINSIRFNCQCRDKLWSINIGLEEKKSIILYCYSFVTIECYCRSRVGWRLLRRSHRDYVGRLMRENFLFLADDRAILYSSSTCIVLQQEFTFSCIHCRYHYHMVTRDRVIKCFAAANKSLIDCILF